MISIENPTQRVPSQSQTRRLLALLGRWITHELNAFFDPSIPGSRRRVGIASAVVTMLVAVAVAVQRWLLSPATFGSTGEPSPPLASSSTVLFALTSLLIVLIASALARRAAGSYVSDIFELSDPATAWTFLDNIATGNTRETIRLGEGRISEGSRRSPLLLIGGPGRVRAESDTAAVFEKADGTPHVVGGEQQALLATGGAAEYVVEGFERLREPLIDLRDQYIGGADQEPLSVAGRSLDGLPIRVVDVRGVFSARRVPKSSEAHGMAQSHFAVRHQDIENLIYHQPVPVLTSGENPSGVPGDWTHAMHALIRRFLQDFMSQNRLTEYLAGTGAHEAETAEFRQDTILARSLQFSRNLAGISNEDIIPKPNMRSRTDLSARFKKYGSEFSTRAQQLGLELHWIGVGTWQLPEASVGAAMSQKQLEAWRMNRENTQRSDPEALDIVAQDAELDGKLQLIQEVPLSSHARNAERYTDRTVLQEALLHDFWTQLGEALDDYYRNDPQSSELEKLEQAVLKIERLLGIQDVGALLEPGSSSRVHPRPTPSSTEEGPPAPGSRTEAEKYGILLSKLNGNYRVAEAMIANESRRHQGLNRETLISRIITRFERHGR